MQIGMHAELNVLTRVAQGVSFTMTFDDILEMLATQASHVLPAKNFCISLVDAETGAIRHAFYLENDDRLKENENRAIPAGQGLEREVITTQRWMVTDDYERECRRRSLIPLTKGIFSWMGVPLNAGEATIGVISVSSRDPGIIFTEENRSMLQAIADQASGAIFKARSLAESERRARQLAKLNEISLSLNSTLEAGALANQALSSASELLGTEAGRLFTIDPQSDELILEATCGKIKTGQLGERYPAETRITIDALRTSQVVIENDTKERIDWFDQNDGSTKPQVLNLIQVPMRIQDRMIGVIELVNKVDGSPFSRSDKELLTAFTSQATTAMENARLYTLTDQRLAARVEELSVMQRIDHELNDSLDIERAMRLTLKWAMRQSGAEAGLVGAWEEPDVRVMAFQGYEENMDAFPYIQEGRSERVASLKIIRGAAETGRPMLMELDGTLEAECLLDGAQSQLVIPIRREQKIIGILFLESRVKHPDPAALLDL